MELVSGGYLPSREANNYMLDYTLKQRIALKVCSNWLVKLQISFAIYPRATREKMASRFASVTSEDITQINDEAVLENTKKATKFGLACLKLMVEGFNPEFLDNNQ